MNLSDLRVKIFADGAAITTIAEMCRNPLIRGFTTNPTLMRKAGVTDYRAFALEVLGVVGERPVSFEVFSDEFAEMEAQAREIASWGRSVYVKVPVTNTRGEFSGPLIERLSGAGVRLNVTALTTADQVARVEPHLAPETPSIVSVFAGRVADTGRDPVPTMIDARKLLARKPKAELLWASSREVLNIVQANDAGCHIITVTSDLLAKLALVGRDLVDFSLETVQMFRDDALKAGFSIRTT